MSGIIGEYTTCGILGQADDVMKQASSSTESSQRYVLSQTLDPAAHVFQTKQVNPNDVHAGTVQGTVTSVYEVGAFFGALLSFFIGERMGRRKMMLVGGTIMIIGTIISVTSFGPGDPNGNVGGFVQFIISRVVTGVGNGMNTATIPSWVAESSKAKNRGFLICMEASTVAVGTVIAYWIDFGLSFVDVSASQEYTCGTDCLTVLCGLEIPHCYANPIRDGSHRWCPGPARIASLAHGPRPG